MEKSTFPDKNAAEPIAESAAESTEEKLQKIQAICVEKKLRLTKIRRHVLRILLERAAAMGAYEILERLAADGFGSQPPVVYRALDFLIKHNFAHKIHRLNNYIACCNTDGDHIPVFFICHQCNTTRESAISEKHTAHIEPDKNGFIPEERTIEMQGRCMSCINEI